MHNILLFETNQEQIKLLVFLLKLADISCTVARSVEEVLNWLSADRLMVVNFDLVLLNSLQGSGLDNIFLTELCEVVTVPVVCVKRQERPPSIFINHHIITCNPDELLDCVKEQLASGRTQFPKERAL